MNEFLNDYKNCIAFGLWMYDRQTYDEKVYKSTIVDNKEGFNKPDAMFLTPMMICLKDKTPFKERDIVAFVTNHLRPRLLKYHKQFKKYINDTKATTHSTMA